MQGHVFISYVHEDAEMVDRLESVLQAAGFSVWRDIHDLWPGEDWRLKIRQAIADGAFVFIACFSDQSWSRSTTFQNEELNLAADQLRQRRPDQVWLIPVRFSDCQLPQFDLGSGRTLDSLQHVDLIGDSWEEASVRLVTAIRRLLPEPELPTRRLTARQRRWLWSGGAGFLVMAFLVGMVLVRNTIDVQHTESGAASQRNPEGRQFDVEVATSASTTSSSSTTTTTTTRPTTLPTSTPPTPVPSSVVALPSPCEEFQQSQTSPPVKITVFPNPVVAEQGRAGLSVCGVGFRDAVGNHHLIVVDCDGDERGDAKLREDFVQSPDGNFEVSFVIRDGGLPDKCPPLIRTDSLTIKLAYQDANDATVTVNITTIPIVH